MNGLEGVAVAAEVLAWIGPMVGLPLLVLGMVLRSKKRSLVPTEIVIVDLPHEPGARWFAAGEICERRLRAPEQAHLADKDFAWAYVSPTDPTLMRLQRRRPITRACLSLGATLAVIGLCGLAISIAASLIN